MPNGRDGTTHLLQAVRDNLVLQGRKEILPPAFHSQVAEHEHGRPRQLHVAKTASVRPIRSVDALNFLIKVPVKQEEEQEIGAKPGTRTSRLNIETRVQASISHARSAKHT